VTERTPNPVERAVELFVFAPLGLALSARDYLPDLVEKGRQQFTGQVTLAKMMGEFALKEGQRQAVERATKLKEHAEQGLTELGLRGERGATPSPAVEHLAPRAPATSAPTPAPAPAPAAPEAPDAPVQTTPINGASAPPAPAIPRPRAEGLAIPGYDTLSASQVVQRLDGLSRQELEAVRVYEASGRGRKTILTKIAQLQPAS
jgi:hypothetical protein